MAEGKEKAGDGQAIREVCQRHSCASSILPPTHLLLLLKTAYCPHTKRIVGYAQDAFDKDVIIEEFKRMGEEEEDDVVEEEGKQDDDEEDNSNNKKKDDKLAQGKNYYVFVVQSLTSNGPPIRFFIAARYCVANLSHRWLILSQPLLFTPR
jgi:hypothetical protein